MPESSDEPSQVPPGGFVSEPIRPDAGTFQAEAMARGMPGLPSGFTWRKRHYTICELLAQWKQCEAYNHTPSGERYYRKHYFRVRVVSGETMTLYAVRHVKRGENPRKRWWLYSVDRGGEEPRSEPER
jgi:hypothetical protein